ncbi:MAG TPA: type II secretion system protein [Desulfuromonadaceae bacterium]|jgi:type II secretory pathway pseudopilin PulG
MKNSLNCKGFTYLTALMLVMVMGIMLGAIGQSWKSIMQREREEELIFRGRQYKAALERWHNPNTVRGDHVRTKLNDLKDLLQDPRTLTTVRYLRRLYTDPLTGKEWHTISDPTWGIIGVASTSEKQPLKIGDFPDDLKDLSGKQRYNEWLFQFTPQGQPGRPGGAAATGTQGGATNPRGVMGTP